MATTRYVVSCSSDCIDLNKPNLVVWSGILRHDELASDIKELKRGIAQCKKYTECQNCDAEIHEITIIRTKQTLKESLGGR